MRSQLALVQHKRQLLPRTFRLGAGQSVMLGGLARFDVLESPSATLYLTVFASMAVPCYMTRTDKLDAKCAQRMNAMPGTGPGVWQLVASRHGCVIAARRSSRQHAACTLQRILVACQLGSLWECAACAAALSGAGPEHFFARRLDGLLGTELQPPCDVKRRVPQWPGLQPCIVDVDGSSWRRSSKDIAIAGAPLQVGLYQNSRRLHLGACSVAAPASMVHTLCNSGAAAGACMPRLPACCAGLGWVAIGVDGHASFRVAAPAGVAVTLRNALLPAFAAVFQRPGLGMRDKPKLPKALKKQAQGQRQHAMAA